MFSRSPNYRKKIVSILLGIVLAVQFQFLFAQPASAQWIVDDPFAAAQRETIFARQEASKVQDKIELGIGESLLVSTLGATLNSLVFFVRKLAIDTATYLAHGAAGQESLIFKDGVGTYLENTALDSVANFVDQLGEPFGLGLCELPDIRLQLQLQIGIRDLYGEGSPTPSCSWQQLKNNWSAEGFEQKYGKGFSKVIPQKFSDVVSVKNSDFGVAFSAVAKVDDRVTGVREANVIERLVGGGFKDLKDAISGQITTPAYFAREEAAALTAKDYLRFASTQVAGTYATGLLNVIPAAANTFISTFVNDMIKKSLSEGLFPVDTDAFRPDAYDIARNNQQQTQSAFSYLQGARIEQFDNYPLIAHFTACPEHPLLDNCVMDAKLAQAVNQAQNGQALTIREAIERGFLHGDWPLISPLREVDNTDPTCYTRAYCYSNIQKLRKARILPLGFEIAALKANPDRPDQNWTLKTVVDNFYNCSPDGRANPRFPYCHLINPNWVITAFPASCSVQGYGPKLVADGLSNRSKECADVATCIKKDSSGSCAVQGFCTKEKNVWKVNADDCRAEYATCRTYIDDNNSRVSYLSRTVDYGSCVAEAVGCRAYALEEPVQDAWQPSVQLNESLKTVSLGRNQTIYFNGQIVNNTCPAGADGCTALYTAEKNSDGQFTRTSDADRLFIQSTALTYLKKAPDYLGCYDIDRTTAEINWPQTRAQLLNDLPTDSRCAAFAQVCLESEVGCELYTSVTDGTAPQIPGIVGNNVCPSECVGYDTYKQAATNFEAERFPLYLIPSNGQACNARYVGCTEFTNIDVAARGGEGLEYYTSIKYCERPTQDNQVAYYSWEGSDQEGYVLRVHTLRPLTQTTAGYVVDGIGQTLTDLQGNTQATAEVFPVGSPAYADDSEASIDDAYKRCNETNYLLGLNDPRSPNRADPDCRALYTSDGTIYYRLLSKIITVSDSCHPLRKTTAELYTDESIRTEPVCTARGGYWGSETDGGASVCRRCYEGGTYQNGSCVYNAITGPGESVSCPAAANECRQYIGNTGHDINTSIIDDSFESSQSLSDIGWAAAPSATDIRIAPEAIYVSQHSLRVGPGATTLTRVVRTDSLTNGGIYELTFWARGSLQNIAIYFRQNGSSVGPGGRPVGEFTVSPTNGVRTNMVIGAAWREYRVGPVTLNADFEQPLELVFEQTGNAGEYFVDYVRLSELQDQLFLIKDSWKTAEGNDAPLSCDSDPSDIYPGVALGCRAYTDSKNNTVYATGFEQLCREAAVGCEPLYDTYNTIGDDVSSTYAHAFNVLCTPAPGSDSCGILVAGSDYSCTVLVGHTNCYIPGPVIIPPGTSFPIAGSAASITASTIIVPADTPSDDPIYLTNREQFQCASTELGCQRVGAEERVLPRDDAAGFSFAPTYVRNNPAEYVTSRAGAGTLCQSEQLGCSRYQSDANITYFKDPKITGEGLCRYREGVTSGGGASLNGWFYDGIGTCSNDRTLTCREDVDCGGNNTCENVNAVPCYSDFVRSTANGVVYDIRSNKTPEYEGKVGVCPEEQHLCTEFIDPSDVSDAYPEGKPYYVKKNNRITSKIQACGGQVSLTEGCVLFDETDNPKKLYSTALTYRRSQNASPPFSFVAPVTESNIANNDSNIVLKVDRDRECAEWLSCKSSVVQPNNDGSKSYLCYEYKACNHLGPGGVCDSWVSEDTAEGVQPLSEDVYVSRGLSWTDTEFSGYSLYNQRQITNMSRVYFDLSDEKIQLASGGPEVKSRLDALENSAYVVYELSSSNGDCRLTNGTQKTNWAVCGENQTGRCYGGICLMPVDGVFPSATEIPETNLSITQLEALFGTMGESSCKVYPESDSPFPQNVVTDPALKRAATSTDVHSFRTEFPNKKEGFEKVNVCQTEEDCSCGYKKITYKNGTTDYWPYTEKTSNIPEGICSSGPYEGMPCNLRHGSRDCNDSCNPAQTDPSASDSCTNRTPAACVPAETQETNLGLSGFCLEYDLSRPVLGKTDTENVQNHACLTWLPIDVSASRIDIFNIRQEAGYFPDLDARVGDTTYGKVYCADATQVAGKIGWDASVTQSVVNGWMSQYFGTSNYFHTSGRWEGVPNLPGSRDGGASERYIADMSNRTDILPLMQSWAWRMLGDNAAVLRVEKFEENGNFGVLAGTTACPDCRQVTQFVAYDLDRTNDGGGYGTIMHPPRSWGSGSATQQQSLHDWRYPQLYFSINRNIQPWFMSSESFSAADAITYNQYVEKNPVESVLRERDVNRVYFVPTSFPADAENFFPQLMSRELYIDFARLNAPGDNNLHAYSYITEALYNDRRENNISTANAFDFPASFEYYPTYDSYDDSEQRVENAIIWTYKVSKNSEPGILSFADYDIGNHTSIAYYKNPLTSIGQRNEIATRYVMVFGNQNNRPSFMPPDNDLQSPPTYSSILQRTSDPFDPQNACNTNYGDNNALRNWFAIGMDFNADGEFLGYISRWCYVNQGDGFGITFATVATLNDQCTSFARVFDDSNPTGESNKAWTNRTWQYGTESPRSTAGFGRDVPNMPFGALHIHWNSIELNDDAARRDMRNYTFLYPAFSNTPPVADGVPYACSEATWSGLPIIFSAAHSCNSLRRMIVPSQNSDTSVQHQTRADERAYANGVVDAINGEDKSGAFNNIMMLFAKVYSVADLNPHGLTDPITYTIFTASEPTSDNPALDISGEDIFDIMTPQIYSINPS